MKVENLSEERKAIINTHWAKHTKKSNTDNVETMRDIANKVFGEENVDLSVNDIRVFHASLEAHGVPARRDTDSFDQGVRDVLRYLGSGKLTVKFPQVEIRNDTSKKHTIHDLYVQIGVNHNGTFSGSIQGARGKFTMEEYQVGYHHSHLHQNRGATWSGFCTGSGPINLSISTLQAYFNKDEFQMFCYHLQSFVAWESRDGRPYIEYRHIKESAAQYLGEQVGRARDLHYTILEKVVSKLYPLLLRTNFKQYIRFGINSEGVSITSNGLERYMVDLLESLKLPETASFILENNLLCEKIGGTYSHRMDGENGSMLRKPTQSLGLFKGQEVFQQVIDWDNYMSTTKPKTAEVQYVHPQITNEILNRIKANFNQKALKVRRLTAKSKA